MVSYKFVGEKGNKKLVVQAMSVSGARPRSSETIAMYDLQKIHLFHMA